MAADARQDTPPAGGEVLLASHVIDGRHVESRDTEPVIDPATGNELGRVARGGEREVNAAVTAARTAFPAWSARPLRDRTALLIRLADAIEGATAELVGLETRDTGMPIAQSRVLVARAADNFRSFSEMAHTATAEAFPVDGKIMHVVTREPMGVAGLITPWNGPLIQATWKAAPALAAGNTVVLKPSELAPLTATRLAELAVEAGFPPGVLNVVHGRGESAGDALVRHSDVDVVSFTGGTATGRTILERGARTLKRFSLELGGKSPVLVFGDADLDRALDAAILGIYSGNGQRCVAGSRILIDASVYPDFVARFTARAEQLVVGDPHSVDTHVGPLISASHRARVHGFVVEAQQQGAELTTGGGPPHDADSKLAGGFFYAPTVLSHVDNGMACAQQEIFGPVAALIPFTDELAALQMANDSPYGLAAYVWTRDIHRAHRVAGCLRAGMVWVNTTNVRDPRAPFGGVKASGHAREGGRHSFDVFTEYKTTTLAIDEPALPRWGV